MEQEPIVESQNQLSQVESMFACEVLLSQLMIRVSILPVVGGTKWYGREIGCFLRHPSGTQSVGMSCFDHGRSAAHT